MVRKMLRKQSTLVTDAETETRKNRNEWCNRTIYLSFKERFIKFHQFSKYDTPYPYRIVRNPYHIYKHEYLDLNFSRQTPAAQVLALAVSRYWC